MADKKLKKYNYIYDDAAVAYGPIYGRNKEDAKRRHREYLRRSLKNPKARLPNGFDLWEAS